MPPTQLFVCMSGLHKLDFKLGRATGSASSPLALPNVFSQLPKIIPQTIPVGRGDERRSIQSCSTSGHEFNQRLRFIEGLVFHAGRVTLSSRVEGKVEPGACLAEVIAASCFTVAGEGPQASIQFFVTCCVARGFGDGFRVHHGVFGV